MPLSIFDSMGTEMIAHEIQGLLILTYLLYSLESLGGQEGVKINNKLASYGGVRRNVNKRCQQRYVGNNGREVRNWEISTHMHMHHQTIQNGPIELKLIAPLIVIMMS